jgi:multidrug efflux pump subunit AcrA (membrane-fusion protein)
LVEIDLSNKDHRLKPGMFVYATFYFREHPNALAIPPSALATSGADTRVFVFVVRQGKAYRVPVKTGIDDGVWVEVVDGLTEDDEVVVVGKTGLTDGSSVLASPYTLPSGTPSSQKY